MAMAARWTTADVPRSAVTSASRSRMSAVTSSTGRPASRAAAFSRLRTRARIFHPRAASARQVCVPTSPDAPVTSTGFARICDTGAGSGSSTSAMAGGASGPASASICPSLMAHNSVAPIRLTIFLLTYVLIAVQQIPGLRINRPAASLMGAVAMVVIGGLPLHDAYAAIDLNVIVFLLGVLLLTAYLEVGGFFEWAAAHIVRRARSAHALLGGIIAVSGLLSAFFINDTICLVLTPLVLAAIRPLGLPPLPFLLAIAMAANVGSAMTVTGNPQNMLIGVSSHITFANFLTALAPASIVGLVVVYIVIAAIHRKALAAPLASTRPSLTF